MRYVVESHLTFSDELLGSDHRLDYFPAGMDVADVGGVVQISDVMHPSAGTYLNLAVLRLGMHVEQHPSRPQRAPKVSQSVADALASYSSEAPGQDRSVKRRPPEAGMGNVADSKSDD